MHACISVIVITIPLNHFSRRSLCPHIYNTKSYSLIYQFTFNFSISLASYSRVTLRLSFVPNSDFHHQAKHWVPHFQSWQKCQHQISKQFLLSTFSALFLPCTRTQYLTPPSLPSRKGEIQQSCKFPFFHVPWKGVSL